MSTEREAFLQKNWPWLLIVFGVCILWYYWGGRNFLAGLAGFAGMGWLAWALLIKPRL